MKRAVKRAPASVAPATAVKTRGRPRNAAARAAMLRAARELLDEGGPGAVTMEAVAARAGVGKPTVYRSFPDRHAVTMAALMDGDPDLAAHREADALSALRRQLRAIAARFATNTGRHVTMLLASADADSELSKSFRHHFVLARRAEGRVLLERARQEKQLRPDVNLDVALDLLYGPLFFRLLMGHAPLDERFMDHILKEALLGLAPR
jgi:AcrR family transcriptional regulator